MSSHHDHAGHHHHHHEGDSLSRMRLAFWLNFLFAIFELFGGLWTNSMAILSDAIHDFGDALAIGTALYLEKKSDKGPDILNTDTPKQIRIKFLREIDVSDLKKVWEKSLKNNCPPDCEKVESFTKQFLDALTKIFEGDVGFYNFMDDAAEVIFGEKSQIKIKSKEFSKLLLKTWIGDNPPNESLKKGLLGQNK